MHVCSGQAQDPHIHPPTHPSLHSSLHSLTRPAHLQSSLSAGCRDLQGQYRCVIQESRCAHPSALSDVQVNWLNFQQKIWLGKHFPLSCSSPNPGATRLTHAMPSSPLRAMMSLGPHSHGPSPLCHEHVCAPKPLSQKRKNTNQPEKWKNRLSPGRWSIINHWIPRMMLLRVDVKSGCFWSSVSTTIAPGALKPKRFSRQYLMHYRCLPRGVLLREAGVKGRSRVDNKYGARSVVKHSTKLCVGDSAAAHKSEPACLESLLRQHHHLHSTDCASTTWILAPSVTCTSLMQPLSAAELPG